MAYRSASRRAVGPVKICNSPRPSSPIQSTRHCPGVSRSSNTFAGSVIGVSLPIAGEHCRRSLSAERLTLFLPPLLAAPRAAFDLLIKVGDHFRLDYHRKEEGGGDAIDRHNHVRVAPECVHSRSSPNNQGCGLVFNALFAKRWP